MDIIDTRIFQVLDTYFEKHGYTYVAKQIDILPNNIHRIKASKAKFTLHQIKNIATLTNCNLNCIFGFTDTKFRKERRSQKLYEKLEEMAKELKVKDI